MSSIYTVIDSSGMPTGSVDLDAIMTAGAKLAFDLAGNSGDHDKIIQISSQTLAEHGPAAFGFVAAAALQIVVEEILDPVLAVTDALGTNLRPGITAVAEGREPGSK
jgi:hypothetical protein